MRLLQRACVQAAAILQQGRPLGYPASACRENTVDSVPGRHQLGPRPVEQ
jgi:hypothetical protein